MRAASNAALGSYPGLVRTATPSASIKASNALHDSSLGVAIFNGKDVSLSNRDSLCLDSVKGLALDVAPAVPRCTTSMCAALWVTPVSMLGKGKGVGGG